MISIKTSNRLSGVFFSILLLILLLLGIIFPAAAETGHVLTINGNRFKLDDQYIKIWGIRTASASTTQILTEHLIGQLDHYKAHGVNMVTVYFMGSKGGTADPFNSTGTSIDIAHKSRMEQIIESCDARGMIVVAGIFYQNVTHKNLSGWKASCEAVKTVANWIENKNYRNVILNIANEQNSSGYKDDPWQRVQNTSDILYMCQLARRENPDIIVGAGGYNDTKNITIGKDSRCMALLFDSDGAVDAKLSGALYDYYVANGVTGKPMINVEQFGGWTNQFTPPGVFTCAIKNWYIKDVNSILNKDGVGTTFHNSPWCQGPGTSSVYTCRYDLAGQGTISDPGIHWYFDYVKPVKYSMVFPGANWTEATPVSQGVDTLKLYAAMSYLAGYCDITRAVVIRNGYLIWKGSDIYTKNNGIASATKSFTSTILGLLIDSGKCTLNTLAKNYVSGLTTLYPDVKLRHFATMTSGYDAVGSGGSSGWSNTWWDMTTPLFSPGTKFTYWDSAMDQFANVMTRIAGELIEDLFKCRIADPIQMNPARWAWGDWGTIDGMVVNGGGGVHGAKTSIAISASELARFGHLFLNRGNWNGTRLISSAWVDSATSVQVPSTLSGETSSDGGPGRYGYNWWCNGIGNKGVRPWPDVPFKTYMASGKWNNKLIVIPEWDMVIVRINTTTEESWVEDSKWNAFLSKVGEAIISPGGVNITYPKVQKLNSGISG